MINLIYFKSPKCAGTSILDLLYRSLPRESIVWYRRALHKGSVISKYPILTEELLMCTKLVYFVNGNDAAHFRDRYPTYWEDALRFAVTRDPYDKLISSWFYCGTIKNIPLINVLRNPPMDGHDYIHFTATQTEFMMYNGEFLANYLVKFENLGEELEEMFNFFHLPIKVSTMYHSNATDGKPKDISKFLTSEVIECVNQRYVIDFEMFGYEQQ